MWPRARHLAISPAMLRRIIRLQHPGLRLIGLRKGIPALLAHALHLPNLTDGLLELLHAIARSGQSLLRVKDREDENNIPRPVILNIILLNLLHVVIRLRLPKPLAKLPSKVPRQAKNRQRRHLQPECRAREEPRDDAKQLGRDPQLGRHNTIDGDKHDPNDEAARDGQDVVLCPVIRDQRGLAEDGEQRGAVHGRAPDPLAGWDAVLLDAVVDEEGGAAKVEDDGVVDGRDDPGSKDVDAEEAIVLTERVELWVAVEEAGRDELVEDAEDEGREDSVEDVVEGERPGFVDDFT